MVYQDTLHTLSHLILQITPHCNSYPHFTDEKTEAQRDGPAEGHQIDSKPDPFI